MLRHGATPLGVDWSCAPTQHLRFVQLLKLIPRAVDFSINDIGCGYGALLGFLHRRRRGVLIDYLGVDLAPEMIAVAGKRNRRRSATFAVGRCAPRIADYSVASGIFNVKLAQDEDIWHGFIETSLDDMAASSRHGFAVNFLAPQREGETGPAELYRADPQRWIDHCRSRFGVIPTLVTGYGLREFTLLVPAARA